jgi:2',3'-cyclic-nucleotide 2'-phosphodiesterase (5'-nucleotidase family)
MFRLLRYTLFSVILSACTAHYKVSEAKPSHYELKSAKNDSAALLSALPYKQKLDIEMKKAVAYSDSALTREGFETSLGNFVMMATEEYITTNKKELAGNCVIMINRGGLRNNLPKGEITKGNIFELMPFDNEIVILKLSGQKLFDAIKAMLKEKKLVSLNLSMKIRIDAPEDIQVNGKPFDISKDFYVITSDYLAMGGDNCSFFGKPISYEDTNEKLRDAIMLYCENLTKNNKHIQPVRTGGFKISE